MPLVNEVEGRRRATSRELQRRSRFEAVDQRDGEGRGVDRAPPTLVDGSTTTIIRDSRRGSGVGRRRRRRESTSVSIIAFTESARQERFYAVLDPRPSRWWCRPRRPAAVAGNPSSAGACRCSGTRTSRRGARRGPTSRRSWYCSALPPPAQHLLVRGWCAMLASRPRNTNTSRRRLGQWGGTGGASWRRAMGYWGVRGGLTRARRTLQAGATRRRSRQTKQKCTRRQWSARPLLYVIRRAWSAHGAFVRII